MHSGSCLSGWLSGCADHVAPPLELALSGVGDSSGMLLGSGGVLRCRLVLLALTVPSISNLVHSNSGPSGPAQQVGLAAS